MKIRTRLTIAFLIIIIVPLLLAFIAIMGYIYYQTKSISDHLGVESIDLGKIFEPTYALNNLGKDVFQELLVLSLEDSEKFDITLLMKTNQALNQNFSYLLVLKGDELVFDGCEGYPEISSKISHFLGASYGVADNIDHTQGIWLGGTDQVLLKQFAFIYPDGERGRVLVATDLSKIFPKIRTLLSELLLSIAFILIMTSAMLMIWIYRGIAIPLVRLKHATQSITEGNLEFQLMIESEDEVGELCKDFEEMRKRLRMQAEEKINFDKQSKELISNISHDLKTPITAVKGYVEGIMDGVADTPERMDKYIKTIYNKAIEMDRLINELTFYSQIDTNRIPYTFSKLKVSEFFSDCIDELKLDLETENIELAYFNYAEEGAQIIADAEQLRRVIYNIVGNSIKYMDKRKGFINIRIKELNNFIQVEIEDNGKGIAEKDLPYIFDRLYRTDISRNSTTGGSGIGLSIVKKIMEDHGGKIWVTSKEATGTVMYLKLRKYQEAPNYE